MTPPSSAPPVFTPPDVPEYALEDELAQAMMNGKTSQL